MPHLCYFQWGLFTSNMGNARNFVELQKLSELAPKPQKHNLHVGKTLGRIHRTLRLEKWCFREYYVKKKKCVLPLSA